MSRIKQVQIFGERCSGTNYLESLLSNNFADLEITWRFGWKHFFPEQPLIDTENCLFIVIYRDPFDWIRSLHIKPHHAAPALKNIPFSCFIRHEWYCEWRETANTQPHEPDYGTEMICERDPLTNLRFRNAMRLRTAKIRRWKQLQGDVENIQYVRYEQLLAQPDEWLDHLGKKFNLQKNSTFMGVETYKGHGRRTFEHKQYRPLSLRDIDFIDSQLNYELEREIGYDIDTLVVHHRHLARNLLSTRVQRMFCAANNVVGKIGALVS